jgi:hypothetical protein
LIDFTFEQNTGIGKIVNGLKKHEGVICDAASNLVMKWKTVVFNNQQMEDAKQTPQTSSNSSPPKLARSSLLNSEIEIERTGEQRNRGNRINGQEKAGKEKQDKSEQRISNKDNNTKPKV